MKLMYAFNLPFPKRRCVRRSVRSNYPCLLTKRPNAIIYKYLVIFFLYYSSWLVSAEQRMAIPVGNYKISGEATLVPSYCLDYKFHKPSAESSFKTILADNTAPNGIFSRSNRSPTL
jgi:hypothetical protein